MIIIALKVNISLIQVDSSQTGSVQWYSINTCFFHHCPIYNHHHHHHTPTTTHRSNNSMTCMINVRWRHMIILIDLIVEDFHRRQTQIVHMLWENHNFHHLQWISSLKKEEYSSFKVWSEGNTDKLSLICVVGLFHLYIELVFLFVLQLKMCWAFLWVCDAETANSLIVD